MSCCLHCKKIEFQQYIHSSLDTFIMKNEETKPTNRHRHYKSKFEHRRSSRNKQKSKTDSVNAKITLEKHVERQEVGCIINLNTTVCGHSYGDNQQDEEPPETKSIKLIDRPVPHCMRQVCNKARHHKSRCPRHSQEQRKKPVNHYYYHSKPVHSALETQYDDVSNKSLDIYLEIPTSYKNVIKPSKDEYQQSKLDTLIKRAKERERKLVHLSRNVHTHTNTYTEASPDEFMSCSELETSLHSRSTLVLDHIYGEYNEDSQLKTENPQQTKEHVNSCEIKAEPRETSPQRLEPTHKGYSLSIGLCTKKFQKYSPSSMRKEFKPPNNYALSIREEPALDIEAYSPSQSPCLRTLFEVDSPGKKGIKIETSNN